MLSLQPGRQKSLRKAGVNVPLLQRQLSLKLENQGRWYLQGNKDIIITTPNWPVTFHSSGHPTPFAGPGPGPHRLRALCPRLLRPRNNPLTHPLKAFLISFYCTALADINPPAQGTPEPPTEGGPIQAEWSLHSLGVEFMLPLTCAVCLWPLLQSAFEDLNMTP